MATTGKYIAETFIAGQDLSAKQYHFVVLASDGQIDPVATAGGTADGVLLNNPDAAGKAATVAKYGRVKVVSAGTIAAGADVGANNLGRAVTYSTGVKLGKATEAAVAGQIFTIDFQVNR